MRFMTAFVGAALLAFAVQGQIGAQENDLTGLWRGTYRYPDAAAGSSQFVGFTMLVVQQEDRISGVISESNTFGPPATSNLHSTIKGTYDRESRKLSFTKRYDGTGGIQHDVACVVTLEGPANQGAGTWQIDPNFSGRLTLAKIPETSGGPLAGEWTGEFQYPEGSERASVPFSMFVVYKSGRIAGFLREKNTFGDPAEPWLHATITGAFDEESRKLNFVKAYDGVGNVWHDVTYAGRMGERLRGGSGQWNTSPEWGGKYTLKKVGKP